VDHEAIGLVLVDQLLHRLDDALALGDVQFLALGLGEAVVFGVAVADEVVAVGDVGRQEQVVRQFIGVAALGAADHLPGGGVPTLAFIPDDLAELLAGGRADLDLEAEFLPGSGDQFGGLVFLRQGRLGLGQQDEGAHRVAGRLGRDRVCRCDDGGSRRDE
jgi:hypothetical protein